MPKTTQVFNAILSQLVKHEICLTLTTQAYQEAKNTIARGLNDIG